MAKAKNWFRGIIILTVVFILSISKIVSLITDYWWFKSLGFSKIFMISLQAKVLFFAVSAVIFFIFIIINLGISSKFNKSKIHFRLKLLVALVLSFFAGAVSYQKWFVALQYLMQAPFNIQDPIFMRDVSFYVFSLPFFLIVWNFLMVCVAFSFIVVLLDYLQSFIFNLFKPPVTAAPQNPVPNINFNSVFSGLKRKAQIHLAVLASFFFILLFVRHYLTRFSIMYSETGIVVGAGYTDVIILLPIFKILMVLAIIIALLFYVWIFFISKQKKLRKKHIVISAIIVYLIVFFIGPSAVPGIIQALKVSPNELNLEKPYIENNIKFTKIAYGLSDVQEEYFPAETKITPAILADASETIDNVRILDRKPLTQTYKQTQEIRLYYDLSGIDVDRYEINGKYTQVMIAPREMEQEQITSNAKTWMNLRMVYTHGFGIVMSPVNKVTKQGMPDYIIKDIPPAYNVDDSKLLIERPQIYYGERDNDFVLVNTKTMEFDYPKGDTNKYVQYDGKGGVALDSFIKKMLMAARFMDIKMMLSPELTKQSNIMFARNIQERISKITPFLILDEDPYIVISDGKLFWIQDAYTVTDKFPYSDKYGSINYIRNTVKVVIDAYDGSVDYYVIDSNDPLMLTYSKIFPGQFKLFESMPAELKKHIRYPKDMFMVQSAVYNTYHMDDATVFYNKEDAWQTPFEVYGTGQKVQVRPYHIIMKLPDESEEEFVLMSTFTPIKKDNMVAWMAARSDGDDYGKLLLYKFPKDKLVYGPLQIEAKIDQDSEISQQLTLWSQQGSRVTRGNLLVIPIKDSLLYVEPLYIQAEKGQLPELKRVLVSDGERVVMEENLGKALEELFGKTKRVRKGVVVFEERSTDELIDDAQVYYDAILDSMGKNWTAFGENFNKLGDVLERIG